MFTFSAIHRGRRERLRTWPPLVEELTNASGSEIQQILARYPVITELVARAWEAASRSAAEENRRLLAKVAAMAINSPDDNPHIDELAFIERSLEALEPPHLQLLRIIGTPRQGQGQLAGTSVEGYFTPEDLQKAWPETGDFILPIVAVLVREGLIENRAAGVWDTTTAWGVSRFGRHLVDFLGDERDGQAEGAIAQISARLQDTGATSFPNLIVRNIGPGRAAAVRLVGMDKLQNGQSRFVDGDPPFFDLDRETECAFALWPFSLGESPPYELSIQWKDGRGTCEHHQSLNKPT